MSRPCAIVLALALAATAFAAPAAVTLDLKDAPLAGALAKFQGVTIEDPSGLAAKAGPVTFAAKGLPVDQALNAILRPQGIEYVWLAADRVRLYPTASPEGMTKQAGRGLRVLASAVAKLETAVLNGDEVRVPDWSDADDAAVARAVIDVAGAFVYSSAFRSPAAAKEIMRLSTGPDGDFRAGAVAAGAQGWLGLIPSGDVISFCGRLAKDPDPLVRAAGAACAAKASPHVAPAARAAILQAAQRDSAALVRLAPALAAAQGVDLAAACRDASPSVRIAAAVAVARTTENVDALLALLNDPHPLVRALAAAFCARLSPGDDADQRLKQALASTRDPWLKLCAPLLPAKGQGFPRNSNAAWVTPQRAALLRSTKISHRIAAVAPLALYSIFCQRWPPQNSVSAAPAGLPDNDRNVWVRLSVFVAAASPEARDSEAAILRGLGAPGEAERAAALLMALVGRRTPPNYTAAPQPVSQTMRQALLSLAKSRLYAERALASRFLASYLPFEEAIAALAPIVCDPTVVSAAEAVQALVERRDVSVYNRPSQTKWEKIGDVVLASPRDDAQCAAIQYGRCYFFYVANDDYPLATRYLQTARPPAMAALFESRECPKMVPPGALKEGPFCQRLLQLFDKGDETARRAVFATFTGFLSACCAAAPNDLWSRPEAGPQARALIGVLSSWAVAQPEAVSLCVQLLEPLSPAEAPKPYMPWAGAPEPARRAAISVLAKVDDPAYSAAVVAFLGGLLRWDGRDAPPLAQAAPDLWQAVQQARERVGGKGAALSPDQITALIGQAQNRDIAIRGPAVACLQNALRSGGMADDLAFKATGALCRSPELLTSDFIEYLLSRAADKARGTGGMSSERSLLLFAARHARQQTPRPAWLDKAAETYRAHMTPPSTDSVRRGALEIYVLVALDGPAVARAVALSPKEDENLRGHCVGMLLGADPDSSILDDLAQEQTFAALPREMQSTVASYANIYGRARGAEAYVVRFLNTQPPPEHAYEITKTLMGFRFAETPALRAAVEAWLKTPETRAAAKQIIEELWGHKDAGGR